MDSLAAASATHTHLLVATMPPHRMGLPPYVSIAVGARSRVWTRQAHAPAIVVWGAGAQRGHTPSTTCSMHAGCRPRASLMELCSGAKTQTMPPTLVSAVIATRAVLWASPTDVRSVVNRTVCPYRRLRRALWARCGFSTARLCALSKGAAAESQGTPCTHDARLLLWCIVACRRMAWQDEYGIAQRTLMTAMGSYGNG